MLLAVLALRSPIQTMVTRSHGSDRRLPDEGVRLEQVSILLSPLPETTRGAVVRHFATEHQGQPGPSNASLVSCRLVSSIAAGEPLHLPVSLAGECEVAYN